MENGREPLTPLRNCGGYGYFACIVVRSAEELFAIEENDSRRHGQHVAEPLDSQRSFNCFTMTEPLDAELLRDLGKPPSFDGNDTELSSSEST